MIRLIPGITGKFAPRSGSGSVRKGMSCSQIWLACMPQTRWTGNAAASRAKLTVTTTFREDRHMAKGLLFAAFDFSGAHADEFHDWYDLEHIPEPLRVPGFLNAERRIAESH